MASEDWIGVGILALSLGMLAVLMMIGFIRRHPALMAAFIVNPGLVGVSAACAFWFRTSPLAPIFWYGAMLLTVPTLFIVMFVAPKAYFKSLNLDEPAPQAPPPYGDEQN